MIHCCIQILLKNGSSMLRYLTFFSVILLPVAGSCRGDIVYQFTPSSTTVSVTSSLFAAQSFNTGNYNQINSISTTFRSMSGTLTLDIYAFGSANHLPTGTALYSTTLSSNYTNFSNLNWSVSENTQYFFAYHTTGSGSIYYGNYVDVGGTGITGQYMSESTNGVNWYNGNNVSGLNGTVDMAAVPEPATMILTGSIFALVFCAAVLRRLRNRTRSRDFGHKGLQGV